MQLQHFFSLLNIEINKIVKSFFSLFVCFSVSSTVDQFQFDLGLYTHLKESEIKTLKSFFVLHRLRASPELLSTVGRWLPTVQAPVPDETRIRKGQGKERRSIKASWLLLAFFRNVLLEAHWSPWGQGWLQKERQYKVKLNKLKQTTKASAQKKKKQKQHKPAFQHCLHSRSLKIQLDRLSFNWAWEP